MSITIPTGDFTGLLGDTIPFAFTDAEIPALHGVKLHWDGEMLHALTTDRYRIGISSWKPGDIDPGVDVQDDMFTEWGSGDEPWTCFLDLPDAVEMARVFKLPAKEMQTPLTVDYEADRRRLRVIRARETGHSAITIAAEHIDADFPDVRRLLASADQAMAKRTATFTAKLLADFAKVRPRGPMVMQFTKRGLVHVSIGERFVGAIMLAEREPE